MHAQLVQAIQLARAKVRWKPKSALRHLAKRKRQGHLSSNATLADYERVILSALHDATAQVYVYRYRDVPYVAIVATVKARLWLVMISLDGIMESAFVIDVPNYLLQSTFEKVGILGEMEHDQL